MAALEDELHSHLDPGEKLLWAGRPAQGIVFSALDWYLIPFSVVWLGLVLHIFWQGLTKTPDPMAGLVSVLFVGIGVYLLIGRFFVDSFYRARLVYGVTDREKGFAAAKDDFNDLKHELKRDIIRVQEGVGSMCDVHRPCRPIFSLGVPQGRAHKTFILTVRCESRGLHVSCRAHPFQCKPS